MEKQKYYTITPTNIEFGISSDREIILKLHGLAEEVGFAPEIGVAIRATSSEARHLADVLKRMADEAEAGLPRA
jgi:hypothetical protein